MKRCVMHMFNWYAERWQSTGNICWSYNHKLSFLWDLDRLKLKEINICNMNQCPCMSRQKVECEMLDIIAMSFSWSHYTYGLLQECSIPSVMSIELPQSCAVLTRIGSQICLHTQHKGQVISSTICFYHKTTIWSATVSEEKPYRETILAAICITVSCVVNANTQ